MTNQSESPRLGTDFFRRFLVAAGILHILLTISLYLAGRAQILPDMFDYRGFGSFASDYTEYIGEIKSFAAIYHDDGLISWLQEPAASFWHTKVVSLSFALLSPLFGFNILSAELYNLLCYLTILGLIFTLGSEIFNDKVGMLAAVVVGLWPSFLLHTTQLLKDPLSIAGILGLVLVITRLLNGRLRPVGALVHAGIGIGIVKMLQLIRAGWWPLIVVIAAVGVFLVLLQMLFRRIRPRVLTALAMLLIAALVIGYLPFAVPHLGASALPGDDRPQSWADSAALRIGKLRRGFALDYSDAASNIDPQYQINNAADLVRYLPSALGIGFFAPFPNMWIAEGGKLGLSVRALSGLETLLMYGIEALAVVGIWRGRRQLSVWYLISAASIGMITLALITPNVGNLYRWRYPFWMILIVLGAGGIQSFVWPNLRWRLSRRILPEKG